MAALDEVKRWACCLPPLAIQDRRDALGGSGARSTAGACVLSRREDGSSGSRRRRFAAVEPDFQLSMRFLPMTAGLRLYSLYAKIACGESGWVRRQSP
ncbi:MAG: hypothetical protein R2856_24920 [Caldilineaceae bacterium]